MLSPRIIFCSFDRSFAEERYLVLGKLVHDPIQTVEIGTIQSSFDTIILSEKRQISRGKNLKPTIASSGKSQKESRKVPKISSRLIQCIEKDLLQI